MNGNDPFFDAWVRDKLQQVEARTPNHLWDVIRKRSRINGIAERNKYLVFVLLLLCATAGIGYWAFHPVSDNTTVYKHVGGAAGPAATAKGEGAVPMLQPHGVVPGQPGQTGALGHSLSVGAMFGQTVPETGLSARAAHSPSVSDAHPDRTNAFGYSLTVQPDESAGLHHSLPGDVASGQPANAAEGASLRSTATSSAAASQAISQAIDLEQSSSLHLTPGAGDVSLFVPGSAIVSFMKDPAPTKRTTLHFASKRHTYLEFYGGPDHVTHYITASNSHYIAYVREVKITEASYPSLSIGMRIDVPLLGDDWRLKSGLHYSQINEKLSYANFNDTKTVAEVSVRRVVQSTGDTVLLRDTTSLTYKGQSLKQSLNAYRRLDIPVIVSHTLLRKGPIEVSASLGALFNITSWYNGDILDTNFTPTALHTSHTSAQKGVQAWKSTIGTSLYGSLAVSHQLTSHIQASIEPYLRDDLSPVNKATYIYREKFVTTGLMFGIRYQLGK